MKKLFLFATAACATVAFSSCVNEWPHPEDLTYNVKLLVHSETDWIPDYYMDTRAEQELDIVYEFKIYKAGDTSAPVQQFSMYSFDFTRADFTVDVNLAPGSYDVYVWSDVCNASTGNSLYYDSQNFAAVTYLQPYRANSNNKDAFRGMKNFTILDPMDLQPEQTEVIVMQRPLSRYIFVATDLEDFINNEMSRGKMRGLASRDGGYDINSRDVQEELASYTIKVIYPLYMPAVFDVYSDKPYDSWTGVTFDGAISPLSATQAALGMDYVMINVEPSSVQVALEIYDNEGMRVGGTSTLNVPILRDRTTIIYGDFLTSDEDAGVVINPDFDGQYNIEYR